MNRHLKPLLRAVAAPMLALGFDPRRALTLRHLPRYWAERAAFKRAGGRIRARYAVLEDYSQQAGSASGHYFHQDLLVARLIHEAAPRRHIDVGSRIDGFVAHVASFREVEVIDIRPMPAFSHPQIRFVQGNLMQLDDALAGSCDSLSCLHALEHFGLGRYGDPIDPEGHLKGFANLHRMLQPGGRLYLAFPIGAAGVYFNAHRVFTPEEPLAWGAGRFELEAFHFVDDAGDLHRDRRPADASGLRYGCGIYVLRKTGMA
jgi:SAM-dependent methyltransferase